MRRRCYHRRVSRPVAGRIKGTGIIGIVRGLRAMRDQALPLLAENLRHYLDERVIVAAWYPETDFLALAEVLMSIMKGSSWERAGTVAAKEALTTVYRNVIIDGNLPETAKRMRVNWRNYHDTGDLNVDTEPSLVRVKVERYCMVSTDLCRLNQAYFATLLSFAGATIVSQQKLQCTARGDPLCVWEFGWRPGPRPTKGP